MLQDVSKAVSSIKIAVVTGSLNLGGSTTFLCNFLGELVRRGVPSQLFSFENEHPLESDFQAQEIPAFCLDHRKMIFEDRIKVILENLARFRPTVVIATLSATSFEVLRYMPKGVFRVGMAQSDDPLVYEMMRHYTPWMDLAAMVSQTMKQKVEAMPEFANVPVAYLPYGVPMCSETDLPTREWDQPLRILYVGRLEREQKRVHLFPEILERLKESGIPFHWTIAGAGRERPSLESSLKWNSPAQQVSFVGAVPYAEVPNLLDQQDIFLLASDYEGLPLSLLEAMGHRLVPVVSDLPSGIREVVDDSNGILVNPSDVTAYADGIIRLHKDRDQARGFSFNARIRVYEKFSVAAMTDRWLKVLTNSKEVHWPRSSKIKPIAGTSHSWRFRCPFRQLRRLALKLRAISGAS